MVALHCIEAQIIKRDNLDMFYEAGDDNLDMVYEAGEPESESERRVSH